MCIYIYTYIYIYIYIYIYTHTLQHMLQHCKIVLLESNAIGSLRIAQAPVHSSCCTCSIMIEYIYACPWALFPVHSATHSATTPQHTLPHTLHHTRCNTHCNTHCNAHCNAFYSLTLLMHSRRWHTLRHHAHGSNSQHTHTF